MKEEKVYTLKQDDGELKVTFGDLANQASNSLIISKNETVVLVTVVISDSIKDIDYFPLSVEYEEKFYSIGAILGSRFMRREGRPSDFAVLKGRIIDRTVRPLFDHSIRNEVQVVVTTLGIGRSNPDVLGTIGTSIALATSSIPWNGPVSSVRVVKKDGEEWNANPENDVEENHDNEIVICGTEKGITMIEVESDQMEESEILKGMEYAKGYIDTLQKFQKEIIQDQSVVKKEYPMLGVSDEMRKLFKAEITEKLSDGFNDKKKLKEIKGYWEKIATEKYKDSESLIERCFEEELDDIVHHQAIENDKRIDGRKMDEVRTLFVKAGGISPSIHGTGVFYRGETHVLSALTLASPGSALLIESVEDRSLSKKFIHHYNFPPFSTGEVGRVGGFNRRMIGHGALAEKALSKIIPSDDDFPYTIRLVSECMSSNGSTSMASVCAGCIALMDGGVPIKSTQAGIAIGLMKKGDKYKILTDIQGPEDHYGDMDLKIAGTRKGITAIQMDIKIDSVSMDILKEAFDRGRKAREEIIDKIESVIKEPRKEISDTAPSIVKISIDPEKIGKVIGGGGKMIKSIQEETNIDDINIEDDGSVYITGTKNATSHARDIIEGITKEYKRGDKQEGEIVSIRDFGAFAKIGFDAEGMIHISELTPNHIKDVGSILSVGDKVPTVVKEIKKDGKIALSVKDANPNFFDNKIPMKQNKGYGRQKRK